MKQKKNTRVQKKPVTQKNNALVADDFFAKGVSINSNKIYPMIVMATMSSGKSTLINALLGEQILPSKNEACTAKMYSILDDDHNNQSELYITTKDGTTSVCNENLADELERANNDDSVTDILIKGHVKGVMNTDKALLIVDTPGPNNSRDESHESIMMNVLNKVKGGLILYVMNATQLGINDDKYLLGVIKDYLKANPKISVVFALNKVDQIDEERESVGQLVLAARDYLKNNGFDSPCVIPVSGLAASLFKKVLNKDELTRSEYRSFCDYYDLYMPKDYNMERFAITEDLAEQYEEIEVRGEKYIVGDLNRAIENTGIKVNGKFQVP